MKTLSESASTIQDFQQSSLTKRISFIENQLVNADSETCRSAYQSLLVSPDLLESALTFKHADGQINVLIHTVGILLSLPHILNDGEIVESLSLGAGNTGRKFDLETNQRIAEYKFTEWKGGPEAMRHKNLFKDFYLLAEEDTPKQKFLYVIGLNYPIKFFNSNKALESVLNKNNRLWISLQDKYGKTLKTVNQYYELKKSSVQIVDVTQYIPQLIKNNETETPDLSVSL